MDPRVSVIIPYYNTADVVAETFDSVLAQTYTNYEIVVVNTNSPDTERFETLVLPHYRDKLKYIFRPENLGVSEARNIGIREARGELVALIDSDDLWTPDYLSYQISQLDADPSADIVYPNAVTFGPAESGTKLAIDPTRPKVEVTFTRIVTEECAVVVSVLAKKAALVRAGLFDEQIRGIEDYDLWLRCAKTNAKIIYHDKVLLRYRRRAGSLSENPAKNAADAAKVLRKIQRVVPLTSGEQATVAAKLRYFEGRQLFFEGRQAFFAGQDSVALEKFRAANGYLGSARIKLLLLLIRTAPGLARRVHAWRYRGQARA